MANLKSSHTWIRGHKVVLTRSTSSTKIVRNVYRVCICQFVNLIVLQFLIPLIYYCSVPAPIFLTSSHPPQMKDSEDSLLNKIKDLSEKLDAKRTGLSNIQWTNDLAVLKSCLEDVEKIQNDINTLEVGGYWLPFYISNFSRN